MELIESKSILIDEVNKIINSHNQFQKSHQIERDSFTSEVKKLNELNKRLSSEISEKDKLLGLNEKKMFDYETMINKIQEDALKETTSKERFDMLKAQDKEIYMRDQEIKRLQKDLDNEKNKNNMVDFIIKDDSNTFNVISEDHIPKIVPDKIVPDKIVPDKVESDKVESDEIVPETSDESSEDEVEVEVITHYNKQYYIKTNEKSPQYIYAIDDDDIGDKVGEIKGKKKFFYDKK